MKTLVIGDTHGCLDELQILLDSAAPNLTNDRLILLGDYIDRGPKSYELLEYLQVLQNTYGRNRVVMLRGNHEQMAIDYMNKYDSNWFWNGGKGTVRSFSNKQSNINDVVKIFESLPLSFTDNHFIYVHAGLRPGINLKDQRASDMLWIREEFYQSSFDFGKTVIFGHTPTSYINGKYYPVVMRNKIALDTACVYGGFLSALEIEEGYITRTYQVASQSYKKSA